MVSRNTVVMKFFSHLKHLVMVSKVSLAKRFGVKDWFQ